LNRLKGKIKMNNYAKVILIWCIFNVVKMEENKDSTSEAVTIQNDTRFKKMSVVVNNILNNIYTEEDFEKAKEICEKQLKSIDSLDKFKLLTKGDLLIKLKQCFPQEVTKLMKGRSYIGLNSSGSFHKDKSILMLMFSFTLFAMLY
jgi:hypothetical protein